MKMSPLFNGISPGFWPSRIALFAASPAACDKDVSIARGPRS
ncbi:hypothetical protein ACLEEB_04655 [Lonsdalea quercina]|nr:hypothetical protein [Lonsdalea quercina]